MNEKFIRFNEYQKNNLNDYCNMSSKSSIKGRVKIYEHKIEGSDKKLFLLHETNNLIVYRGRNWLMQRAFAQDMSTRTNWSQYFLGVLAVGTGGAATGNPLNAISPDLANIALDTHATLGSSSRILSIGTPAKDYHLFDSGYPRYITDPDITDADHDEPLDTTCTSIDPIDSGSYACDTFLISQIQCTIDTDEGNGSEYQDINEAGLFVVDSSYTPPTISSPSVAHLFARVTFPSIRKTDSRRIVFVWQIYF